ncbi:MAG: DUF167 domain-containing protein [Candidatus Odinarchaeia archaeon]
MCRINNKNIFLNKNGDCLLWINTTPNSKKDELYLDKDGTIVCHLKTKPIQGKANKALIKILSKKLGIKTEQIQIKRGVKKRLKLISIIDCDINTIKHRLYEE